MKSFCHCASGEDNKLSIHFGEDKTKYLLFSKMRGLREVNKSFEGHSSKQHETGEYLGCQHASKLSGEPMASKVLTKINDKLKFPYHQSRYLTPAIDYRCSSLIMDVPL